MNKIWYAVYTKPRWEKKVSDNLTAMGIENYCPLTQVSKQWSDRKKIVFQPLFTSYVFVHATDQERLLLNRCDGVVNLLYWLGKPAIIRDAEIEIIKEFLGKYHTVELKAYNINLYDRVRIIHGPFSEMEGIIMGVHSNTVKVELPSLGVLMYAQLQRSNLKVLRTNNERITRFEESAIGK
jgi:transcription antitermination factor NusG